ncbi:hypothetical protein QBC36DRAFT_198478 [Triangularia setosa]|uniref:Uncharacterized protein n=1 Tax=Triangularia setosa TaxID=2587417 RepID=A0AAN6VXV8_9PEZI|nr:hypothetical protein QBC36DRAFT_198478 [Podospora setosa]
MQKYRPRVRRSFDLSKQDNLLEVSYRNKQGVLCQNRLGGWCEVLKQPPPEDDPDDSTDTDDDTGAVSFPVKPFKYWDVPADRVTHRSHIAKLDDYQQTLILEVLRRGTPESRICRMCLSGQPFPNKVLWMVFDCFFKAVLVMAYPIETREGFSSRKLFPRAGSR